MDKGEGDADGQKEGKRGQKEELQQQQLHRSMEQSRKCFCAMRSRERERERDAMELFLLVSVVDGGKTREVEKGGGERKREGGKQTARCAMGQIWLVNVFVELLKAIDETEAAMIYDKIINLEKIRKIFKLKLLGVL